MKMQLRRLPYSSKLKQAFPSVELKRIVKGHTKKKTSRQIKLNRRRKILNEERITKMWATTKDLEDKIGKGAGTGVKEAIKPYEFDTSYYTECEFVQSRKTSFYVKKYHLKKNEKIGYRGEVYDGPMRDLTRGASLGQIYKGIADEDTIVFIAALEKKKLDNDKSPHHILGKDGWIAFKLCTP